MITLSNKMDNKSISDKLKRNEETLYSAFKNDVIQYKWPIIGQYSQIKSSMTSKYYI